VAAFKRDIKIGMQVFLMGGSYPMTVLGVIKDTRTAEATGIDLGVHCVWHDRLGQPRYAFYPADALMINEEDMQ
jgi:uncharacterized protein YodC (DUF2158 family)